MINEAAGRNEYLSPEQLAEFIQVPVRTVYRWRAAGDYGPPAAKFGRHVRYRRADVEAWAAQRVAEDAARRGPPAPAA